MNSCTSYGLLYLATFSGWVIASFFLLTTILYRRSMIAAEKEADAAFEEADRLINEFPPAGYTKYLIDLFNRNNAQLIKLGEIASDPSNPKAGK